MIKLENIYKSFKTKTNKNLVGRLLFPQIEIVDALVDINLEISDGEAYAYVGPNGAGKSTTIKLIAGLMKPTKGSVRVGGLDPYKQRIQNLLNIGMVMGQRNKLFWDLPVIDSLKYHCFAYKISQNLHTDRIKELSTLMEIEDLLEKPTRELSLGQRARCNLAMNFLHHPKVLLLDEPSIGLDYKAKHSFRKCVRSLIEQYGASVLLTSHDLEDVENICEKIAIINKSKIIYSGDREGLSQAYNLHPSVSFKSRDISNLASSMKTLSGVISTQEENSELTVFYDKNSISESDLVSRAIQLQPIHSFKSKRLSLEELIDHACNA